MRAWMGLAAAAVALGACGERSDAPPAKAPPPGAESPTAVADPWEGRWLGPEGLFLQVDAVGEGTYRLLLRDTLDSQATYDTQVLGDALAFTRKGERILIRHGTGAQTGFKYLVDKTECLIVVPNREGYCRL